MKSIFLAASVLLAVLVLTAAPPASAASFSDAQMLAKAIGSNVVKAGGCLDDECAGDTRERVYIYDKDADDDTDDDDDGYVRRDHYRSYNSYDYRERRYTYRSRGGSAAWCWGCAARCEDGWCPPNCYGWRRQCQRDGY
jgi:hypothetical protein